MLEVDDTPGDFFRLMYPLLLMLLTLIIFKLHSCGYKVMTWVWYPFCKCLSLVKKDWGGIASMIDVFATFLLLSYGRVISVSFNLLVYICCEFKRYIQR